MFCISSSVAVRQALQVHFSLGVPVYNSHYTEDFSNHAEHVQTPRASVVFMNVFK